MNELKVVLHDFEGPLDLLLHLVRKYKMDIKEIPLIEVIEQYLSYLDAMQEMDLDIASEYLVMASQLILIKSRRLLPTVSEDYEVETQDLEDALIDQIEEYRRYKEASEQLSALHQARATHYSHEKIEIIDDEVNLRKDKTAIDLFLAFSRVLEQKQQHFKDTHTTIAGDNYSIEDKMVEIRHLIRERKHLTISALFAQATSLDEMISDFLALLELVKTNVLTISQDEAFDEVYLDVREDRIEEDVTPV